MADEATTPDGGAPTAPPPTSRRRTLWVATGVAGLTGVVGLAALGGLAARDDRAGGPERVADNRAVAPQNAGGDTHQDGGKGRDRGEWGGEEDHGKAREIPCDDDALVDALELATRDHGGTLKLAENCTYELGVKDRKVGGALPGIKQDVTIKGNGSTIKRDAEDTFRIFRVAGGGHLTLDDLTVTGGNAAEVRHPGPAASGRALRDGDRGAGDGGALLVERGGKAHLSKVTLAGNNAEHDGGAVANFGRVWLEESTVVDNHARGDGGGIFNRGILKIEESHVDDNTAAGSGGGIANGSDERRGEGGPVDLTTADAGKGDHGRHDAGTVEITGGWDGKDASWSTLSDNRAGKNGGGLFSSGGYVTVSFTHITGNTACENGGGIYAENTDLDLDKVVVAGNHADGDGGGVVTTGGKHWGYPNTKDDASATISDSVIVDNTANRFGGGIYNGEWLVKIEDGFLTRDHDEDDNAALTLRDTLIKGNTALNGGGIFNNKAKITLTKTHVTKNTATDAAKLHRVAGGVLNNEGHVKLDDDSLISDNDPTNCANTVEDCFN
ncbi:hypothetical protein [Micromonospora humi]|uniref:Polymorphic outer membrane protein repeat-containing protein n=2 Tax=Micromonospora humi TaxID=745366 RepID=A0A1C5JGU8_9ACTN|nr:hypothetical protein [Micromonospora humi]SCG69266.1 polymorphic outer membrane protein repeat-containing protein [Micromonospora humi]